MSKTALIILAAVVVLIVIVVLTGMRFLRADDEDEFDGVPAERGRTAGDDVPAGRGRARRDDDRGRPEADGRASDSRTFAGRTARGRTAHGRSARGPQRPDGPVRRGQDRAGDPVPAGMRSGRGPDDRAGQRGSGDYDDRPARPAVRPREYEDRDGRGTRAGGSPRDRDVRDRDVSAGRDDLSRRSGTRANSRPDDRRDDGAPSRREELLPPVRSRQGRGKRDSDGEWPSSEWDELSDVDYWAELASDKPLTTTAQPAGSTERPRRSESRRDTDSVPVRSSRSGSSAKHATEPKLPVRSARQHQPVDQAAAAVPGGSSGEFGVPGSRRTSVPGDEPTLAMLASMGPKNEGFGPPGSADDDPLTSPSFPRISADDSRSYHRGRPETPSQDTRVPDGTAQTQRFAGYPGTPPGTPGGSFEDTGQRGTTPPGGYPRPAGNGPDYAAAAASAADPYRSGPSGISSRNGYPTPVPPTDTGGYRVAGTGGYPAAATGSYPAIDASGSRVPASGSGGYPVTGSGGYPTQVSGGPAGYPADASTNTYAAPTYPAPTYPAPTAAANGYPAGAAGYPAPADAGHQARPPGQGGYPATGSGGYLAQSTQPVPGGYPAEASTGAYPAPATNGNPTASATGGYSAGWPAGPVPAELPLSYPGYGPGGLAGGASPYLQNLDAAPLHAAGSRGPASAQGGEPAGGYPGYPAGQTGQFPAAPSGGYATPTPQLPGAPGNGGFGVGYSADAGRPAGPDGYPVGQFHAAPYEPAGYPAPAYETGGYAGADPYAMDPYGYPGYRNGGF